MQETFFNISLCNALEYFVILYILIMQFFLTYGKYRMLIQWNGNGCLSIINIFDSNGFEMKNTFLRQFILF